MSTSESHPTGAPAQQYAQKAERLSWLSTAAAAALPMAALGGIAAQRQRQQGRYDAARVNRQIQARAERLRGQGEMERVARAVHLNRPDPTHARSLRLTTPSGRHRMENQAYGRNDL